MPMRSPAALYNVSDLSFMSNMSPKSKTLNVYDVVICYKPFLQSAVQSYTQRRWVTRFVELVVFCGLSLRGESGKHYGNNHMVRQKQQAQQQHQTTTKKHDRFVRLQKARL
jgi:hypothetical protein